MKKILLTGSTGFIGACLAHYLAKRKAEVHVITRETSNNWRIRDLVPERLVQHTADLREKERIAEIAKETEPDLIYHLAAYGAYHYQSSLEDIVTTNVSGTRNLLEACSKAGFEHFVTAGTSAEYGIKNRPMRETDLLEPVEFYGVAKAAATLFCQCFAKVHELPVSIIRPFAVYGYYEAPSRFIPSVVTACLRQESPRLLSPNSVRDFVFIEDVIAALLKVSKERSEEPGQVYNVGSGKEEKLADVASMIIKLTGADVRPIWDSAPARPRQEPKHWVSDSTKIRRRLGWKPNYDLRKGLSKTISWFEKNMDLYEPPQKVTVSS